jgi:hypothetical protein
MELAEEDHIEIKKLSCTAKHWLHLGYVFLGARWLDFGLSIEG